MLVLVGLVQLLLTLKHYLLFGKASYPNEEFNRTEPSLQLVFLVKKTTRRLERVSLPGKLIIIALCNF